MFDQIIFYDTKTGKVVNEEVTELLTQRKAAAKFGVGIISKDKAIIENGYLKNMPSKHITHDPIAYVRDLNEDDPDLFIKVIEQKRAAERAQREKVEHLDAPQPVRTTPRKYTKFDMETDSVLPIVNDKHYRRETDRYIDKLNEEPTRKTTPNVKTMSKTQTKQSAARNRNNKKNFDIKQFIKMLITVLLVLGLAIGSISIIIGNIIDSFKGANNAYEYQQEVAEYIAGPEAEARPSIISRNKHYPNQFDRDNYWFDNEGIAIDILKLPDEFFDATLFSVYLQMGNDRKNAYIDNFSEVIKSLSYKASPETTPLAYARVNGCESFEDFLAKNGYTVEEFELAGKTATNNLVDDLENVNDERGR